MAFRRIDRECRRFWEREVSCARMATAHREDKKAKPGVSLVIVCPLPHGVQNKILAIEERFDKELKRRKAGASVKWRRDMAALHITVYGLVKPKDYRRPGSWPLPDDMVRAIRYIAWRHLPFVLQLQGLCVLGRGAIAVRISDSVKLDAIRRAIENVPGVSARAFGEKITQMIIGRLSASLTFAARQVIRDILRDLRTYKIGQLHVDSLELVHYKHEFLDRLYDQVVL